MKISKIEDIDLSQYKLAHYDGNSMGHEKTQKSTEYSQKLKKLLDKTCSTFNLIKSKIIEITYEQKNN